MSWQIYLPENAVLITQREKLGLSQDAVAQRAGITLEQYQRYEKQGVNISSSSLRIVNAVLTALELDPTAFANGDYCLGDLSNNEMLQLNLEGIKND